MATLEFIQSSNLGSAEILFGDFSETEVASIIYRSSVFNNHRHRISFGSFSEEEVTDLLSTSRTKTEYVSFDFDEIADPVKHDAVKSVKAEHVEPSTPIKVVKPATEINDAKLSNLKEAHFAAISTPDRHDIDDVMRALIEEAVKSSSKNNTNNLALSTQNNAFSFQQGNPTTAWSNGTNQPTWSNGADTNFSSFYSATSTSQNIWSSSDDKPVWSNGTQWSSLFKGNEENKSVASGTEIMQQITTTPAVNQYTEHHPQILSENISLSVQDHNLRLLGSQLQMMSLSNKMVEVIPRGLVNKSTNCFIHSPLQALLVTPLYHVIQNLDDSLAVSPTIRAMKQFFDSFRVATGVVDKLDPAFEPTFVYEMLRNKLPQFNENGRQEDAEEFLGIILSSLHDEMVSAAKFSKKTLPPMPNILNSDDDGEWQQIGRKNKIQVTRNTSNNESSLVSELFGGITRSVVSKAGAKESATLQPFLSLQLDIQDPNVTHVNHALAQFTHREQIFINDTKCYRQESLERLPPVLILHLKRFIFDEAAKSCQKLHKEIDFDIDLCIEKQMMSALGSNVSERSYKLFGVVYHHGNHTNGGHYSAMVYHPYIQCWINCDDDKVTHQEDKAPLIHHPGRSAYLLFYQRVPIS